MLRSGQPARVFASVGFVRYFIGQALSYVGDGLRLLALPLLVFHLTKSALSTGASLVAEVAPFAIFAMVGGSFADRVDRRKLMIVCDAIRFAVMAAFTVLFAVHLLTVPMIYGGLVIMSIAAAFFMGGQSPSIPYLVGRENTTRATALLTGAENTSNLATPALGGALFSLFGPLPALAINACTYLASQISLAFVPSLGPETSAPPPKLHEFIADVRLGFRHLFSDPAMRAQSMIACVLNTLGFGCWATLIPYLKLDFGASDREVGFVLAINAIGALCGSLAAGHLDKRWPFGKLITTAYMIDAIVFLPVIFVKSMWLVGLFWAASNVLAQYEIANIIGWRLRILPEGVIGRAMGAVRLIVMLGVAPGVLGFGWVADHYGARMSMAIGGLGYVVIALIALASPVIRNERR